MKIGRFYEMSAVDIHGKEISFSQLGGKVVLIVNTASKCGYTKQYAGLESLYRDYKNDGLVILGFPCNQFAGQEPGDDRSIIDGCMLNYGVTFPMFSKVKVNGKEAHELFVWLKSELPGIAGERIKWNFTKFLLGRDGEPIKRYASKDTPDSMRSDIEKALGKVDE